MKKRNILILSLITLFTLASCNDDNISSNNSSSTVEDSSTLLDSSSIINSSNDKEHYVYLDFTPTEKKLFSDTLGYVIPFVSNNEYYVEKYSLESETGVNFYTYGNSNSEFQDYLKLLVSDGFVSEGNAEDEYGDVWYYYCKDNVCLDVSFYSYDGKDIIDIYAYKLANDDSNDDSDDNLNDENKTPNAYNKLTSSLADYSGNYLIVYEGASVILDGSLSSLDAKGNYQNVSIVNNSIDWTESLEDYSFTIEKYGNGYSILSSSGMYIGSTNSGANTITSNTTPLENEINFDGGSLNIVSSVGTHLRYNTSDNRFRYYKSSSYKSQAAVSLFKLDGSISSDDGNNPEVPPVLTDDVTTLDFNSSKITYKNKSYIDYYEFGCPSLDNGTKKPKVLVVPVEFSDATAASKGYTIEGIENAFLPKSQTNATLDYVSVYDYFYKSSYGKLSLDITVCQNWFKPKYSSTHYASAYDEDGYLIGDQMILDEALASLSTSMDLSSFDSDGDTVIDAVVLVNTLEIDGTTDFYWAYQYFNYYTDSEGYYYEYDGVSANTYLWASYKFMFEDSSGDYTLKSPTNTYTFIHEFSHVLGADDYYDYSEKAIHPLDGYDMMDICKADHNPFTKMHYGWIDSSRLITTNSSVTVELAAFEDTGDTIIIANNYDITLGIYQEYWVICYYNSTGLNEYPNGLFDAGVVVYHVNAELSIGDDYNYTQLKNTNSDVSYEYGSEDNLIEFVKNGADFIYVSGDSLNSAVVDDNNKKVPYTFKVDSLTSSKATLTFTVNK